MIFIDSWIWIEYFSEGPSKDEATSSIEELEKNGGVTSSFAVLEVKYRLGKMIGRMEAEKITEVILEIPDLSIIPLSESLAFLASDLKMKYYTKKNKFSYGDAIMLSTALASGCSEFHTGDPDFEDVTEIPVKVV